MHFLSCVKYSVFLLLCDPSSVDVLLIRAHFQSRVLFPLISFVIIKSWVIAGGGFSFLFWTEMPVAYFQLMYSWVLGPIVFPADNLFSYTAFCSDYTASTLSARPGKPLCLRQCEKHIAPEFGKKK